MGSTPADPLHHKHVRNLIKQIRKSLLKTENIMRKTTRRLEKFFTAQTDPDEIMIVNNLINLVANGGDDYAWMSTAMQSILSLKDNYRTDGTRKVNDGHDALDKGAMRNLIRVTSENHMTGIKARLGRLT